MSVLETIIVYTIGITAFYVLLLWFIHKASVYFKRLDEKMSKALTDFPPEEENENTCTTLDETIEYAKRQETLPKKIEVTEDK